MVSARGTVAAGNAGTVAAAAEILRAGGNAYDAAIAAGFAAAVVEPGLTSLAGGGFLLARTATGDERLFDFFVDTPGLGLPSADLEPHLLPITVHFPAVDQVFNVGMGSAAVPGVLPGYLYVHAALGRLPLADVLEPAVRLAARGIVLDRMQAYVVDLLEPILTMHDDGRALFAPQGRLLREGDTLVNPDLAAFLRELAAGGDASLHSGAHAANIAAAMAADRGVVTEEDLSTYRVIERDPLVASYRGRRVLTNPPPSFGGTLICETLRLLAERPAPVDPVGLAEVLVDVDRRRAEVVATTTRTFGRGTTHVSVADAEGNVAAMTTSNGEGCGWIVPGTGVMVNNMMGEDDLHPDGFHAAPPGERVGSMMSPTILVDGDRVVVLGSGGSKRIRTAIAQVIAQVVDVGSGLEAAVLAPRIHWDGDVLQVEPGIDAAAVDRLRRRWPLNEWTERSLYFGGAHCVDTDGDAGGDPRRGGSVAVVPAG